MLARWRAAGLIAPALMTLALLPVLIGLGSWQWHRKAWKEDLIAKVEARRLALPVSYVEALGRYAQTGDVEYLRVRLSGTFDHAQERHVYAPSTQSQGWNVYTLLRPDGGLPPLFVNRGWVPDTLKDLSKRADSQVTGPVTITGLARLSEQPGLFTMARDDKGNRWYWRDLPGMESTVQPATANDQANLPAAFAPFSIDAEAEPANPGGFPKGGTTEIHLSNSHLQYVVTWYGLALTLLAIFAVYARQRLGQLGKNDTVSPQP